MGADGLGRPSRRRPHVGDGERARVGRDDGALSKHGVQAPEQLVLLLAVFGNGLDHQVANLKLRESPGLTNPAHHRVSFLGGGLALLDACVEEGAHLAHAGFHGRGVGLEHHRFLAAPGADDGDVRPHRSQTDDAYLLNLHEILLSIITGGTFSPPGVRSFRVLFSLMILRRGAVAHLQSFRMRVSL